jgi:hypothetical protein
MTEQPLSRQQVETILSVRSPEYAQYVLRMMDAGDIECYIPDEDSLSRELTIRLTAKGAASIREPTVLERLRQAWMHAIEWF